MRHDAKLLYWFIPSTRRGFDMDCNRRLQLLLERLTSKRVDVVALLPGANFTYYTGLNKPLSERPFVLFVQANAARCPVILLPRLEADGFTESLPYEVELVVYTDEQGYERAFREAACALNLDNKSIGMEPRGMRLLELREIEKNSYGCRIVEVDDVLSQARMLKDADEIAAIRQAIKISEAALASTCSQVKPGMTELDVQTLLNIEMLNLGAHGHGFDPLILSGPRAALPHTTANERVIEKGDCLLFDFGASLGSYSADITRTFSIGTSTPIWKDIYEIVKQANAAARSIAAPGVTAEDVDAAARRVIDAAGYGNYFTHRTGHGLGLQVHEPPYIVAGNNTALRPGMVFTIEPGIYLQGRFGVRIEDDILITDDGAETLSTSPRSLIAL